MKTSVLALFYEALLFFLMLIFSLSCGLGSAGNKNFKQPTEGFRGVHGTSWCVLSYATLLVLAGNPKGSLDLLGFVVSQEQFDHLIRLLGLNPSKIKKVTSYSQFVHKHPITSVFLGAWIIHSGISLKLICKVGGWFLFSF